MPDYMNMDDLAASIVAQDAKDHPDRHMPTTEHEEGTNLGASLADRIAGPRASRDMKAAGQR